MRIHAFLPVMAEGLHVHVHRAGVGTRRSLEGTDKESGTRGRLVRVPACVGVRRHTCRQTAKLTLEPKAVLTALEDSPTSLKSFEKECVRARRGRSSAITTQLRTHDRFTPRA